MKITCPDCSTSYEIKAEAVGPEGRSVKCAKCGNRWFVSPDDGKADEASFDAAASAPSPKEDAATVEAATDEAEWAADAAADGDEAAVPEETARKDSPSDDEAAFASASADTATRKDEEQFSADLAEEEDDDPPEPPTDIESQAKRPKITVNPDKFRRNHIGALLNWLFRRNYRRVIGILVFVAALSAVGSFVLLRDTMVKQFPDLASLFEMVGFDVNLRGLEFRNLHTFSELEDGKSVLVVEGSIRNLEDKSNAVPAVRLSIRNADHQEVYAWTVEPRTKALNGLDETRFRTILADPPDGSFDIQVRFTDRGQRQIVLE